MIAACRRAALDAASLLALDKAELVWLESRHVAYEQRAAEIKHAFTPASAARS